MAECGFPGIGTSHWHGLFCSSRVPGQIVHLLHEAAGSALAAEEVRTAITGAGARVVPSESPQQFAAEIAAEMAEWKKVTGDIPLNDSDEVIKK